MAAEWAMTAIEFDVLWRQCGHGEPPYPLELPSPGRSDDERAQLVAAVHADLADRDLVRDGGVDTDLVDTLGLLARCEVLLDGRVQLDDHLRVAAARVGDHATMVLQTSAATEFDVRVRRFDGARLGTALADLLPQVPPAYGQSVSMSHQALTAALAGLGEGDSLWDFEQALKDSGVRGADVRWLAGLVGGPGGSGSGGSGSGGSGSGSGSASGGAQFGVTRHGHRVGLVSYYATADGGVLMQRHGDSDWITVAPSDPARVITRLEELAAAR